MAVLRNSVLDWLTQRRVLRRWRMSARQASSFSFKDLRKERAAARKLRHELNELIAVADHRLALPVIAWQWASQSAVIIEGPRPAVGSATG